MATKKTTNSKNTSAVDNTAEGVQKNDNKQSKEKDSKALKLMATLGVSTLWKNSREEYFTEEGLALASEDGNKENIKEYKR